METKKCPDTIFQIQTQRSQTRPWNLGQNVILHIVISDLSFREFLKDIQ